MPYVLHFGWLRKSVSRWCLIQVNSHSSKVILEYLKDNLPYLVITIGISSTKWVLTNAKVEMNLTKLFPTQKLIIFKEIQHPLT